MDIVFKFTKQSGYRTIFKYLSMCFLCLGFSSTVDAQIKTLEGKVFDADRKSPLAGITISIKGKNVTTVSNAAGVFSIRINIADTLLFTSLDRINLERIYKGESNMEVYLESQGREMEEVVVVGYGVLKKKTVVGAVAEINGDEIKDRPTPNVTRALQGQIPGLNVIQSDGKPNHGGNITVRGQNTSFKARKMGGGEHSNTLGQGGGALVLIDGAEGDINTVNPEDILTVSVLKDASSAAVYGARGAFGVILITTRKPKGNVSKLSYGFAQSFMERTVRWEENVVSDPVAWVEGFRESYQNAMPNGTVPSLMNNYFPYSDAWYEELKRRQADPTLDNYNLDENGNYIYYGATNWLEEFYKPNNKATVHSLNFSGGSEAANYYLSGRMYTQDGIYKIGNEDFDKYNVRGKGSIKIKPWLTIDNNTSLNINNYLQPMVHYGQNVVGRQVDLFGFPVATVKNPDGSWTQTAAKVGYAAFSEGTSFQDNKYLEVANTSSLLLDIVPAIFNVRGDFTYKAIRSQRQRAENLYTFYTGLTASGKDYNESSLEDWRYDTDYISANVVGTYTPELGHGHNLNLVAGWNLEDSHYKNQKTYRTGNLYPSKPGFTLMDGEYYSTLSGGNTWGLIGLFSRINYNFHNRYIAEISFRYDGSSKFPKDSQWGFFPSASLGWNLSEESFLKERTASWLNNFKIRGSVGSLGNANISPYQFLETLTFAKSSVLINGNRVPYTDAPSLIPEGITWETVTTYNIGADIAVLNNRLNFVGDYYHRYTTDLYTVGPNQPQVLGSSAPRGNFASLKTRGWEASLTWKDKLDLPTSPLQYSIKAMVWDSRSWVTDYFNANGDLTTYYEGMELGEIWGFRTAGIYASNSEAKNGPAYHFFKNGEMFEAYAGDLKFVDLDGDGIMTKGDRTLNSHGDMEIIGNTSPRYQFGFNLAANWKGFGISGFFQGVLKKNWYPWTESGFFWGQHNRAYGFLMKSQTGDNIVQVDKSSSDWVVTNMDKNPYWTRRVSLAANRNDGPLTWENTHYLQDAAYIRLKNITLDYSLPTSILAKVGVSSCRVYVTAENLWTYSPMFKYTAMFDPEVIDSGDSDFASSTTSGLSGTGNGYSYPMLKNITLGLNISF
ncbi:SusC/RagA family TonB-linked outer membrane protein [Sphingobacterium sp. C459-1T]|uniref:SusC/RagA family TonB-linked outer membrane protein n=2 Tax=Sphingobacterium faecale TaxID=2803775 RepID=A0ABS1R8N9_9SPHI|nr:SusC/RagA family TonB-linked outer membrane protein [Sphingobacterium faecale]